MSIWFDRTAFRTMTVDSSQRVVFAGYTSTFDFALTRLNADGTNDLTFNGGTMVTTNIGGDDRIMRAEILPGDKIRVTGTSFVNPNRYIVQAQYNADGTLDAGFGVGGILSISDTLHPLFSGGLGRCNLSATLGDGTTLCGTSTGGTASDFFAARFLNDFSVDTSFGMSGIVQLDLAGAADFAGGLFPQLALGYLQSGSTRVSTATSTIPQRTDMAIVRYLGGVGSPASTFTPTGTATPTIAPTDTPTPSPTVIAGCAATPVIGCTGPSKELLKIKNPGSSAKNQLLWKWIGGTASKSDFGDPVNGSTGYRLCLYRDDALLLSPQVTADGNWSEINPGFKYKNPSTNADGYFKILLKEGAGKAKILVKARGANLGLSMMPLAPTADVTLQLVRTDSTECWESVFAVPFGSDSEAQFKDKE